MNIAPRLTPTAIANYAPVTADPLRLASVTMQAVDKIGVAAAAEIDQTAGKILEGATEIAGMLRDLATTLRQQSAHASEQVTAFCGKATMVIEGVRELQEKIAVRAAAVDERMPSVVAQGPREIFSDVD